jgi:hypothetical protein
MAAPIIPIAPPPMPPQPRYAQPAFTQPVYAQPTYAQPTYAQPIYVQPTAAAPFPPAPVQPQAWAPQQPAPQPPAFEYPTSWAPQQDQLHTQPIAPPASAANVVFDGQERELAFQAPEGVYVDTASGSKRKKAAGIVAAFVLLAGGGATAMALRAASSGGGAATPDKAVRAMIESVSKGDLLGAVDTFPASERTIARDLVDQWVSQAKRLGNMADGATLSKADGYKFAVTGLQTKEDPVTDNVVNVQLTAGAAAFSTDLSGVPLGSAIGISEIGQSSNNGMTSVKTDLGAMDSPIIITTVHDDEGWHPSLMFSAFDTARRNSDSAKPTAADAIKATGSATPEAAVTDMINALGSEDIAKIVELLPPGEFAAAHVYGRTLVPETSSDDDAYQIKYVVSDLVFETQPAKAGKKLIPTKASIRVTPGADSDELATDVTLTKKGAACVVVVVKDKYDENSTTSCTSSIAKGFGDWGVFDESPEVLDIIDRMAKKIGELGFVVVNEQGKWYVSPVRTYGDALFTFMSALTSDDSKTITDFATGKSVAGGGYRSRAQDKNAQSALKVMVTNAKAMYGDAGNYSQADATGLADAEPGFVVVEGHTESDGPRSVSVLAAPTIWTGAALSDSGVCFYISDSDDFGTLFASSDSLPCNAASMPAGQTNW